jgi:hypothetical protein
MLLSYHCRDSILYRLILGHFTAHDNWASWHNITIMSRMILHIMHSFPAIKCQTHNTFLHSHDAFLCLHIVHILTHLHVSLCIFAFHCTSLCIFVFHCVSLYFIALSLHLVHIIAGASIHCPASPLVHCISIITISDYAWHCTIFISLWTLTLPHLHT